LIERPYDAVRAREKPEIPVDEARRANPFLHSTAAEGGWRIVIIDGAEAMNTAAANAILKLLEEPPPKCLILLISHQPGAVMPTIRSRCSRLALSPVDAKATEQYLNQWFRNTNLEERALASAIAPGQPGAIAEWLRIGVGVWHAMIVSLLEQYPKICRRAAQEAAELIGRADDTVFRGVQTLLKLVLERITRRAAGVPTVDWGDGERLASIAARAPLDTWICLWENTCSRLDRIGYANLDRVAGLIDVIDCWSPDRVDA
jgi:DNA polymerase-3 subunit delta'